MTMTAYDFIQWRKARGLTQTKAGEALGVSLQTIQRYEAPESSKLHVPVPMPIQKLMKLLPND